MARSGRAAAANDGPDSARDGVKRVALAMFQEHGFRNVSVRDLMGARGMTPGALYAHFPSKEELLYELICDGHAEIRRLMEVAAGVSGDDLRQRLVANVYVLGLFQTEHQDYARLAREIQYLQKRQRDPIQSTRAEIRQAFEALLSEGVSTGVFDCEPVPLTAMLMLNMTNSISGFYDPSSASPRVVASHNAHLAAQMVTGTVVEVDEALIDEIDARRADLSYVL